MSLSPTLPKIRDEHGPERARPALRYRRTPSPAPAPLHFSARIAEVDAPLRHAELFYLQKQIQLQTPMVIVLEDGEHVEGCI